MKGRNKDQGSSKQSVPVPVKQELSFPDVTPLDHVKMCPRYTSVLNRPEGDGVGIEELDSLQMEIESLLVSVIQRNRQLKIETMILDNEKISDNILAPQSSNSTTKASTLNHNSNSSNNLATPKLSSSMLKKTKSFSGKPNIPPVQESPPIVRNKIPDIFWQSVEPYCADITQEDIKYLKNQIEQSESFINSIPKIEPLGTHYSLQWAEDDLNQQVKEGARFPDLDSKSTPTNGLKRKASVSSDQSTKKIEESIDRLNKAQSESLSYGPLTQRLISALIEQNLMTPFDNKLNDYLDRVCTPQSTYLSPKSMAKKFTFNFAGSNMEKKLKKTLIEQGILEPDESEKSELISDDNSEQSQEDGCKDDEIAQEIINIHSELKLVSKQCKERLEELLGKAEQSLARQEIKKKIDSIDKEIINHFEIVKACRISKQPLDDKDKEQVLNLIKERDSLKQQLD
ncbi:transcriptional adapter 3 [Brachionus plicatilis]|uniref:Transcriptional adapter 3 n=1 Tax=Brachionus plicatilis TaxID=10195 RepID=A0A3M7Q547_BRAPC|nr:transcriptional adapter 3 [Brachionus plicatilis]